MNIFYLDPDPDICAQLHCDKHNVKMILEYAQLLSTAHHVLDGDDAPPGIYKVTHGWTDPPQCMPDQYKAPSAVTAYQRYYRGDKSSFAVWKLGNTPAFM